MASKKDAYLEHLAKIPLFADCTKKELREIASAITDLKVEKGHVLMHEGGLADELFVIVSGTATVRRRGRKIATVGPGEVLGELTLLTNHRRMATVVADTDMELMVIDRRQFEPLLDDVPGLAKKLLKTVLTRLVDSIKMSMP